MTEGDRSVVAAIVQKTADLSMLGSECFGRWANLIDAVFQNKLASSSWSLL